MEQVHLLEECSSLILYSLSFPFDQFNFNTISGNDGLKVEDFLAQFIKMYELLYFLSRQIIFSLDSN
jgi:hypothetical protein